MTKRPSLIRNLICQHSQHDLDDLVVDAIHHDLNEVLCDEAAKRVVKMKPEDFYDMLFDAAGMAHNDVVELCIFGPRK